MTDARLRELERRWKRTGAVEDHVALLLERLRVGGVELRRVEVAAYCGCPGAAKALGVSAVALPPQEPKEPGFVYHDNIDWVSDLDRWGRDVLARAFVFLEIERRLLASRPGAPAGLEPMIDWTTQLAELGGVPEDGVVDRHLSAYRGESALGLEVARAVLGVLHALHVLERRPRDVLAGPFGVLLYRTYVPRDLSPLRAALASWCLDGTPRTSG